MIKNERQYAVTKRQVENFARALARLRAQPSGQAGVAAYYSGSPEYAGTVNVVRLSGGGEVTVRCCALDIARVL